MIGRRLATLATLFLLVPTLAMAQRGGGGRPSMGGGGGGFRGGGMGGGFSGGSAGRMSAGRPSLGGISGMSRGPSMGGMSAMPRGSAMGGMSRPSFSGSAGLGAGRPTMGGAGSMSMARPSVGGAGSMTRPSMGGSAMGSVGMARPSAGANSIRMPSGAGTSGASRPSITPGTGRPSLSGIGLNTARPNLGGQGLNPASLGTSGGGRPSMAGNRPGLNVNGADLVNRQAMRPTFSTPGGGRPSLGTSNGGNAPGLSANRPQVGTGNRPGIGGGRPGLDAANGGTRPGTSNPGLANTPGSGGRPSLGTGERPGIGGSRPGPGNLGDGRNGGLLGDRGPVQNGGRPSLRAGERPGIGGGLASGGVGGRPGLNPGERPGLGHGGAPGGVGGGRPGSGWNQGGGWAGAGGHGFGRNGPGVGRWRDGLYNNASWRQGYWTGYGNGFRDGFWTGSLGWGLGGWGMGWGNMGWGWGNMGWGWGTPGWGWGWGGWGLGGLGFGGWGGLGLGLGLGWGNLGWGLGGWGLGGCCLSPWMLGSPYYSWGFANYVNPYVGSIVVDSAVGFDAGLYAQPLDTVATTAVVPTEDAAASGPAADFESARAAFRVGQYAEALRLTEKAIAVQTQDATLHEFRALCLFALGRYDEAAATLYAVLAVGPGWDWPTLIALYPSVDVYTSQQRRLEDACAADPTAASERFVLAYHYLTQGHRDAAVKVLRKLVALQPKDTLSAQLLAKLDPTPAGNTAAPAPAPALAAPGVDNAGRQYPLNGTWKAQPNEETTITLTVQDDGAFTWDVTRDGQTKRMSGTSTLGKTGLLTLAGGPSDGALVGQLHWADADHVRFALLGAPADDPGLNFARVP